MSTFVDDIEFKKNPDPKINEKEKHIVIVGAGIIGVCTAYYLTRHPSFDSKKHHITILESKRVAGGASGKAGGLLATWAFPQQIVPYSFQLHQELSDEYNGETNWDYRRLTTVSLEADVQEDNGSSESRTNSEKEEEGKYSLSVPPPSKKKRHDSNNDNSSITSSGSNTSSSTSSYSDPDSSSFSDSLSFIEEDDNRMNRQITENLRQDISPPQQKQQQQQQQNNEGNNGTSSSGMTNSNPLPDDLTWIKKNLIKDWSSLGGTDSTAQVHPYKFTHFLLKQAMETGSVDLILGKVQKILFDSDSGVAKGCTYIPTDDDDDNDDDDGANVSPRTEIDISATHIILCMGPWTSKLLPDCPISGLRAHSITIKPSTGTVSPYAIFTELQTGPNQFFSPEMYARKDEVYVCGEGDTLVSLPESSDDVEVVKSKCDELYYYVSKLSPHLSDGHILKRQACYLPVLNVPTSSGPLIGETNVGQLYVGSGHSCWGINNAPATGKVLAELLYDGVASCCDISALDPSLYFDASVFD
ncbi:related to Putative oxidoreductase TDA3 [Saccharomycodes ludwigii]|uniref:Related to Putative oxidoreductase TDA3 n=1 Tax=Saccharomycodes ludwigii TaxID=36035 RepID=A0A376B7G0_9ASCO|nr:hypothetical protein SCDLUD_004909 [Saccharomycodes ludwigii]KAH3899465.1 hypothetical protein SCDLUD_004909 [Saccharomycodes ludwigii]SSD60636.1 related to Putative oxidoreductase TDA3 [Saccharomycodes ludwigii]